MKPAGARYRNRRRGTALNRRRGTALNRRRGTALNRRRGTALAEAIIVIPLYLILLGVIVYIGTHGLARSKLLEQERVQAWVNMNTEVVAGEVSPGDIDPAADALIEPGEGLQLGGTIMTGQNPVGRPDLVVGHEKGSYFVMGKFNDWPDQGDQVDLNAIINTPFRQ